MVFTILEGCFSDANDNNVRECECTNGTYGSYYGFMFDSRHAIKADIRKLKGILMWNF